MSRMTTYVACLLYLGVIGCMPIAPGPGTVNDPPSDGTDGAVLSGTIRTARSSTGAPAPTLDEGYMIVAQSNETGEIYRAVTDENGDFELDIPASEMGNTFMVSILAPDGQAVGPVVYAQAGNDGLTGLALDDDASLGTIDLPEDPNSAPVQPGTDADVDDNMVDPNVSARVDVNGVPVGLGSHGKGDDADSSGNSSQTVDADQDGLVDILDADDDGDGIVDDFDGDGDAGGMPDGLIVSFFMNLKIDADRAPVYYGGDTNAIDAALALDTVITLEAMTQPSASQTITAVEILETPAPPYMPVAEISYDGPNGIYYVTWSDSNYALDPVGDRFEAFVRPNEVMNAGDTFTAEITFDDGTVDYYSRMINFVFKNIPRLLEYGESGSLTAFDVSDPNVNGTRDRPIPFDGTEDLVLVFNPPPDETGAYLTGMDYSFQVFYQAADYTQLNDQIDMTATWPSPPAGFDRGCLWVLNSQLTLSVNDTYTFTLPKEMFPDTVETASGGQEAVASYKIDITAETTSGNAAIMLEFVKQ